MKERCSWVGKESIYIDYHDKEWGVPVYEDIKLFEFLILEGAQAGLSWITILNKRENYRKAFEYFNVEKIALYDEKKIKELMVDEGIIRNKLKIESVIKNAKAFLGVQKEFGSFSKYIWSFVGGKTIKNKWEKIADIPTETDESKKMSKDLKKRGFKFVGPTICYSFMQAVGMVNDHVVGCFRYNEV